MTPRSTLRQAGFLCLLACAASGYVLYIDRHTALGLSLVEMQATIPLPIPAGFALLGLVLLVASTRGRRSPPIRQAGDVPTQMQRPMRTPAERSSTKQLRAEAHAMPAKTDGWDRIHHSCNQVSLPPGATIHLDRSRPCPIMLRMEMAAPERCKRAVDSVASWFASISIPPRFRVEFVHCPKGASPRHHMVNGAIAQYIPRGEFKVIADRDAVDVIFHRPGSGWHNPDAVG